MDFTSRQLRAFHLAAEHLSFTRAAEQLLVTPSGLSVAVRELENQLGFRLFDRTTRHVVLTAQGTALLGATRPALQEIDAAVARVGTAEQTRRRTISLGATPMVAANILPRAIREFRGQRPDLRVSLFDGSFEAISSRVEAGELDLGLGIFKSRPGLRRSPFFRFSLMVIRADRDGEPHHASTTWSALNGQTLISLPSGNAHQQVIDKQLAKAKVTYQSAGVVQLLDTQIALVEAGEGIAIIPSFGLPACRARRVVMSRLINPVVDLEFHQISDRGRKLPAEAEELTAFLKTYISRWAGRAGVS
jgi:LysR family transcriptional regulator, carnitine catabolism transcriptional activator